MRKPTRREAFIGGISLTVTIALSIFIIQNRGYIEQISHWGYFGCFFINVLSNGTFILPGFGVVFTFTMGGVLNPAIVGAVAGIGEAIGAIGAYFTGYAGRGLFKEDSNSSLYLRFSNIMDRHGSKAIFVASSILSPFFYPFAVFLGMAHYGWFRFFLATWAGRTVKSMVAAYLGYFGLKAVLQWLGLDI